jgi:cyclase
MRSVRLIARLDIKAPNLIKGIHLEGLRVIGDPNVYARKYYDAGADELLYMDIVASLYDRNSLTEIVESTTAEEFVPTTVGGGVRSVEDARKLLASGADKVAINTAAVKSPKLIAEVAQRFGSQAMVLSIEAKRTLSGGWEAYTDNGREHTGLDVVAWAKLGAELGAGEILLTSVDYEGTRKGFDVALVKAVTSVVSIPVIASGGLGTPDHLVEIVREGGADAVAVADAIHYGRFDLPTLRRAALDAGLTLREVEVAP